MTFEDLARFGRIDSCKRRPFGRARGVLVYGYGHSSGDPLSFVDAGGPPMQETHYFVGPTMSERLRLRRQVFRERSEPVTPHVILDMCVHGPDHLALIWSMCDPPRDAQLIVGCYFGAVCNVVGYTGITVQEISPRILAHARRCLIGSGCSHVYVISWDWSNQAFEQARRCFAKRQLSDVVSLEGRSAAIEAGLISSAGYREARGRYLPVGSYEPWRDSE